MPTPRPHIHKTGASTLGARLASTQAARTYRRWLPATTTVAIKNTNLLKVLIEFGGDLIVVGGDTLGAGGFSIDTVIDGLPVNCIARWDGQTWDDMDGGLNGCRDAFVWNGDLYAAATGGLYIWTGSAWSLFAATNGTVSLIGAYDGDLIIYGSFTLVAGNSASYFARWDGASWHAMTGAPSNATYLVEFDGKLYIWSQFDGGTLYYLQYWDGSAWATSAITSSSFITLLAVYDGDLYAMTVGNVFMRLVGGSWSTIATSTTSTFFRSMVNWDRSLVVAGTYSGVNSGISLYRLAKWDGATLQPFDGHLVPTTTSGTPSVVGVWNRRLAIAGSPLPSQTNYGVQFWSPPQSVLPI